MAHKIEIELLIYFDKSFGFINQNLNTVLINHEGENINVCIAHQLERYFVLTIFNFYFLKLFQNLTKKKKQIFQFD